MHTAAIRRKAYPQPQDGTKRCPANTGRSAQQPPAKPPCQRPGESADVATGRQQRLRGQRGVLRVIAAHSAAEDEAVAQWPYAQYRLRPPPRHPFRRQSDGVPDGQTQQAADDPIRSIAQGRGLPARRHCRAPDGRRAVM